MAAGKKDDRTVGTSGPVLVRGDDDVLVRDAVLRLVEERLGGEDRALALAEFAGEDYELAELVDAAQTPPFLTTRRLVVGWGVHRFKTADLAPLVAYLADPLESTELLLVFQEGRVPKALTDALAAAGGTVLATGPQTGRGAKREFIDEHLTRAGLRLDNAAKATLEAQLGEDVGRLVPLITTLSAVYGDGARIGIDEVEPFLGEAGCGAAVGADRRHRQGRRGDWRSEAAAHDGAGERHPLPSWSPSNHFHACWRSTAPDVRTEKEAADLLGMKGSTFPAKKAMHQGRKLGSGPSSPGPSTCWPDADVDLRGATAWESEAGDGGPGGPPRPASAAAANTTRPPQRWCSRTGAVSGREGCRPKAAISSVTFGGPRRGRGVLRGAPGASRAGLLAGCSVLVDDALGGGLVDLLDGQCAACCSAFSAPASQRPSRRS
jgi:DNA polymerase-3 subunit delta